MLGLRIYDWGSYCKKTQVVLSFLLRNVRKSTLTVYFISSELIIKLSIDHTHQIKRGDTLVNALDPFLND